jgi:hypothetical protein
MPVRTHRPPFGTVDAALWMGVVNELRAKRAREGIMKGYGRLFLLSLVCLACLLIAYLYPVGRLGSISLLLLYIVVVAAYGVSISKNHYLWR